MVWFHVREVRHSHVVAEAFAEQMLDYLAAGPAQGECVRVYERVPRPLPSTWWPGHGERASQIKEIAG